MRERGPTNRQNDQLLQGILGDAIALVNQTAILAPQHGYGMTAMDDDALVAAYNDSLANFGASFAATQETIKN